MTVHVQHTLGLEFECSFIFIVKYEFDFGMN